MAAAQEKDSISGRQKRSSWFYINGGLAVAAAIFTVTGGGLQLYDRLKLHNAAQVHTANVQSRYEKAKQLFYENSISSAIIEARKAIQSDPKNCKARKLLAACYGVQNKMEACATEYREAVNLDHHDDEALIGLGTALEALGDVRGAKEMYERVASDPDATPARRQHARERTKKL